MKRIALLMIALTLGGCGEANEGKALFQKMEAVFNSGTKSILLSEITSFPWDNMCLFQIRDSYDSIAYSTYLDYLEKKDMEGNVPNDDYGLILIFTQGNKVAHEYFQKDAFLTVDTKPTEISLASKESFVKFCSGAQGLKLTYVDAEEQRPTIYISREE